MNRSTELVYLHIEQAKTAITFFETRFSSDETETLVDGHEAYCSNSDEIDLNCDSVWQSMLLLSILLKDRHLCLAWVPDTVAFRTDQFDHRNSYQHVANQRIPPVLEDPGHHHGWYQPLGMLRSPFAVGHVGLVLQLCKDWRLRVNKNP